MEAQTVMIERTAEDSQRAYARFAGLMFLVVLGFDIAGLIITSTVSGGGNFVETSQRIMASELLYRIGLCFALIGSLSTILLAVGLYVAVKPVDGNLAMTAMLFRIVEAAVGAVGVSVGFAVLQIRLAANHAGAFDAKQLGALVHLNSGAATEVSAISFCLGSSIFFYLFMKSRYIPRIVSAWGIFASLLYLAYWSMSLILPQYATATVVYASLPILIAELSTAFWLLIVGIRIQPGNATDSL
jgi:hypothetical protein